jgi:hypothetical protein
LMKDEHGAPLFTKFVESEWSIENILCYQDIMKYPETPQKDRKEFVKRIIELYFNGTTSELEVNVPGKPKEALKQHFFKNEFNDNLFADIHSNLLINLYDSYSRFIVTKEFENLVKTNKFLKEQEK